MDVDENGCHTAEDGECISPGPCLHTMTPEAIAHVRRMERIKNLTAFEDVSKEASDAVDAVLARFDGQPATQTTYQRARCELHAALMALGFDCPFRIESNYVGGGTNNPRVIFLTRAQLRVMKTLATECPEDIDAWAFVIERYNCEL